MPDRRKIKGAPYTAIKAYLDVAGDRPVSIATLAKLPALREYKSARGAARRACLILESEGYLSWDVEAQTVNICGPVEHTVQRREAS